MRIRTIKPEFWVSESVGRLSRGARLLFIGLWSFADDSGRARGTLPAISGALFPYDTDARELLPRWMEELEREGMVRRYKGPDGNSYLDIPKWLAHQRIEKPSKSRFPEFTEHSPTIPGILPEISPLEQGTGNREQGPMEQGEREAPTAPTRARETSVNGGQNEAAKRFTPPTRAELDLAAAKIGLPLLEVDKFEAYYGANGWRVGKSQMKSWTHAMAGWAARWRERESERKERTNGHHRDNCGGKAEWLAQSASQLTGADDCPVD